ncbi:MAG: peptidase M61 [Gemmatimonadales bacterium]|nr:MAG: peptidase M61 [Gemmatimonadales bacterium]
METAALLKFALLTVALCTLPVVSLPPLAPASLLLAQSSQLARSAPISDVRYEIAFDSATAASREIRVRMTFRTRGADPVLLSLPAWTPGAYEMGNFARYVLRFEAVADGRQLRWDKLDFDTWRVWPEGTGTVVVSFAYRADTLDNAMSWSRPDFVLFNGTNVFLYPEGQSLDFSARVTIRTEPHWKIATGMTFAGEPRTYRAESFHELADMPVFVGRIDLDSSMIGGIWYRLATYPEGVFAGSSRRTFWQQLAAMVPVMERVFGEIPWSDYTTLIIFDHQSRGGSALEHQNSHVGIYHPAFIGNPVLASITAHEIFHAWNVKRLRPAELVPYDYSRPQPTTLLWVSEGITDYYADLAMMRSGVLPEDAFYDLTLEKIQSVQAAPPVSLEDASLSTWIDPVDGSRYLYYPKGSLAGLLLDILIRDASDNRASLDSVLRALYRETYKSGRGFTVNDFWAAVSRAAGGKSFDEFARRYVDGREPLPYAEVFPLGGFAFRADTTRMPQLGVFTVPDTAGIRVTAVSPGSSAAEAGVQVGDYLVRIGDVNVTGAGFGEEFRARYRGSPEGTPLAVVVRRGGRTRTLTARLRFGENVEYYFGPDPDASAKAKAIREGILGGTP